MRSVTRPRGPLPSRVYWSRRLLVLGVAALLVVGIARALGMSSDGKERTPSARVVGADPATATASRTTDVGAGAVHGNNVKPTTRPHKKRTVAPLAQPSGPCEDTDVVVTAAADRATAGGDIAIRLLFTTKVSEACTFAVSQRSVVLRLTSGDDKVWSSQQCPKAIGTTMVVARKLKAGEAVVTWNGQRSNEGCSRTASWALPGYYHAEAAALGGEPTDVQFRLYAPQRPTITPRPKKRAND